MLNQRFKITITCAECGDNDPLKNVQLWLKAQLAAMVENVFLHISNYGFGGGGRIFEGQLLLRSDMPIDADTLQSWINAPADAGFSFSGIEKI